MILGFAHITKNIPTSIRSSGAWVPNAPEKWPLMARQAVWHRIEVRGQEETVEYDGGLVGQPSRLASSAAGLIWLASRKPEQEVSFFCDGMGFRQDDESIEVIRLASSVSGWSVTLNVFQDDEAPLDPPLDIAGYAALAFFSTNVEADRDHLLKHGGRDATKPFTVKLDREMKIVMLRSPEGTIIELIQVKGKA